MSGDISTFVLDKSLIGCRFEQTHQEEDNGTWTMLDEPAPIGILVGWERVALSKTALFIYDEDKGFVERYNVKRLDYYQIIEEDRAGFVRRIRSKLNFPKPAIEEVPREALIDLDD